MGIILGWVDADLVYRDLHKTTVCEFVEHKEIQVDGLLVQIHDQICRGL